MALRNAEEETCESFTMKLAKTRSRTAARQAASIKSIEKSETNATEYGRVVKESQEKTAKKGSSSTAFQRGDTRRRETMEKAESTIRHVPKKMEAHEAKPAGAMLKQSTTLEKGAEPQAQKVKASKEATSSLSSDEQHRQALEKAFETKALSRPVCKRGRSGGLKLDLSSRCVTNDNLATKYRRPHCPLCSQLGCLRNLEVVCYCDACQECRSAQCSSPRMADFRKSHKGYESRVHRDTLGD